MAIDNNASSTWKAVMKIRGKLPACCTREIAKGSETDLYIDLWIEGKSLINHLGWDTILACGCPKKISGQLNTTRQMEL